MLTNMTSRRSLARMLTALVALVPWVSYAAYNDAHLSGGITLTVGGINLVVQGDGADMESITVSSGTFSVTMPEGSYLRVTSADRRVLTPSNIGSIQVASTCTSSQNQYTYQSPSGAPTSVMTVAVDSSTCSTSSGSGSSGGGGGGGGGGSPSYTYVPPVATPAVTPSVTTPVPVATAPTLSSGQVDAIIGLLRSFNAEQSVIDNVKASLTGKGAVSNPTARAAISGTISRLLAKGMTHSSVKTLQQILNADPDTRVAETGTGSPGNESSLFGSATQKAVQRFQVKYGIAVPGQEGYGSVGPKTRAKLNELRK